MRLSRSRTWALSAVAIGAPASGLLHSELDSTWLPWRRFIPALAEHTSRGCMGQILDGPHALLLRLGEALLGHATLCALLAFLLLALVPSCPSSAQLQRQATLAHVSIVMSTCALWGLAWMLMAVLDAQ